MKHLILRHVACMLFAFGSSFYLVPLMKKIAMRWGILDHPDGKIKTQSNAIPYLGGLAVYISFIASLALFYPFHNKVLWLLIGVTLLLFVGLIDDLSVLTPLQKLLGQLIAIFCFLRGGLALKAIFFSTFFNLSCSVFWMALVINAFNLVDVMDGLASMIAICSGVFFFVISILYHQYDLSLLMLTFISPIFIFFIYNKPPAQIYLGDCGSMFLGGFLSAIPLLVSWSEHGISYGYLVSILILAVPLLEVSTLIIIRTFKGIPFYQGSPHHFAIYLRKKGWPSGYILLFVAFFSLIFAILALGVGLKLLQIPAFLLLVLVALAIWSIFIYT